MRIMDVLQLFYNLIMNILTAFVNLFIKRDKSIVLMGSWYGTRFGGNSRYLFQYLHENREKYGLSKVIWVTRKKEIYEELKAMGYEAYMMKSIQGIFYHFKAGIHAISVNSSTSYATNAKRYGDIMGELSLGAVHIFLNHGISSVKGNNLLNYDEKTWFVKRLIDIYTIMFSTFFFRHLVLHPGGWDEAFFLSISKTITQREKERHIKAEKLIYVETGYPELCECLRYTEEELRVINKIKKYDTVLLYLPTYRTNDNTGYSHPLDDPDFLNYIVENNYLWIDKLHPGAKDEMKSNVHNNENVLSLDSNFDINTLYRHISVLITDYSSVYQTAYYFDIPLIFYVPDFEEYCKKDKSLIGEFSDDIRGMDAHNVEEFKKEISDIIQNGMPDEIKKKYAEKKQVYFDNRHADYDEIVNCFLKKMKEEKK